MGIFKNKDQFEGYNIYSMKKYVDKKRMIFTITAIIVVILTLALTIYYLVDTNIRIKKGKEFANQITEYEQNQKKIEEQKEAERKAKIPQLTEAGKENLKNIYHSQEKIAYLTFDDGPNAQVTPKVLKILKKEDVKATFFVIGKNVEAHPEIVKQAYEEGHYIGNHGYSHNNSILYKNDENFINEIRKTDEAISKAIGEENYSSKIFRFPNGFMSKSYRKRKDRAEELLKEMNYSYLDWNCLNNDSIRKYSKFQLVENLKKSAKDKDILIILMHDTKDVSNSSEALEDSIKYLKSKGYKFKNFYD